MNIEQLKAEANRARKRVKTSSNGSELEPQDMLFVLHNKEVQTLEEVLLDLLAGEPIILSREQKRDLINIIKYMQED